MRPKTQPQPDSAKRLEPSHGPLAELARRQHGVVSIRQLVGPLGYSRRWVSRPPRAGRRHRLHRGAYAVCHPALSLHGRCLAAVLASAPDALLSHHSAAWLWGIARWSPIPLSVTVPGRRAQRPPIRLHHSGVLAAADSDLIEQIPVTSVPRTALDL